MDQTQLDEYVLGTLPKEVAIQMAAQCAKDPLSQEQVRATNAALEALAMSGAVAPPKDLRNKVLLALDTARKEEVRSGAIPYLHTGSSEHDLAEHLRGPEIFLPEGTSTFHQIVLEATPERCTVVVWLKDGFPEEIHSDQVERILILEGSCEVQLGDDLHALRTGDTITIPMHVRHSVRVTSNEWCKAIVQRVAA